MEFNESKSKYPDWVKEFAYKYRSRTISQYLLHGNINDYLRVGEGDATQYLLLRDFMSNDPGHSLVCLYRSLFVIE